MADIVAQLEPYSSGRREDDSFRVVFRPGWDGAVIETFDFKKNEMAARGMVWGFENGYIKVEMEEIK